MRLTVDRDRCVGSGLCAWNVPDVFDQSDDDGRVRLLQEEPAPGRQDAVRAAIALCPLAVIGVVGEPS